MTSLKILILSFVLFFSSSITFAAKSGRSMKTASKPAPNVEIPATQDAIPYSEIEEVKEDFTNSEGTAHPFGILALIFCVGGVFLFPVITEAITKKVISDRISIT